MSPAQITTLFAYHPPTPDQSARYDALRAAGKACADAIFAHTPMSAERVLAIRKIQEGVQMACAAIACNEPDATAVAAILQSPEPLSK